MSDTPRPIDDETLDQLPADPTASHVPRSRTAETQLPIGGAEDSTIWRMQGAADLPTSPTGPAYQLRRVLGRGGMGEVWEAVQVSLGRVVAVKRMVGSEDDSTSRSDRARGFQQEAMIAARLEHPNIVPVHDLGMDPDGAPLMAMKLVNGESWDRLLKIDFAELGAEEFLARHLPVLVAAAQAIAFAHSRGVIHRDMKPSQVMVGAYGEVQLMDWGLAILVEQAADALSPLTPGAMPSPATASNPAGTPALMAPEQTEDSATGIGPWTDVFLLGGTLYFLLTNTFPYAAKNSRDAFHLARRCVIEAPSLRLPSRRIPGELEALCMRALSRDPKDRPATASEFVGALQDFMTGASRRRASEQLVAEAGSALTSLDRERHGLVITDRYARHGTIADQLDRALQLWPENGDARRLRRENLGQRAVEEISQGDLIWAQIHIDRLEADGAEAGSLKGSLSRALARRDRARRSVRFLGVAAAVLLLAAGGLALRASIARADADRAEERRRDQEELQKLFARLNALRSAEDSLAAEMDRRIPLPTRSDVDGSGRGGRVDAGASAGLIAQRRSLAAERAELAKKLPPGVPIDPEPFSLILGEANLAFHADTSTSGSLVARGLYDDAALARPRNPEPLVGAGLSSMRAGELVAAAETLDLATTRTLELYGTQHPAYAQTLGLAAMAYQKLDSSSSEAIRKYRASIEVLEPQWIEASQTLAERFVSVAQYDDAIATTTTTIALAEREGVAGRDALLRGLRIGAVATRETVRYDESERLLKRAIAVAKEASGERSLLLAGLIDDLGELYFQWQRIDDCEREFRVGLAMRESLAPPDSVEISESLSNLGAVLSQKGKFAEAEPMLRRSLAIDEAHYGPNHPEVYARLANLGFLLMQSGRVAEALPLVQRNSQITTYVYGRRSRETAQALGAIGVVLQELGRGEESVPLLTEALAIQKGILGRHHPNNFLAIRSLAYLLIGLGRQAEAIPFLEEALALARERSGGGGTDEARLLINYANVLGVLGRGWERRAAAEEAVAVAERTKDALTTAIALRLLWSVSMSDDCLSEAEEAARRALAISTKLYGDDARELRGDLRNLADALVAQKRDGDAVPVYRRLVELTDRWEPESSERSVTRINLAISLMESGGKAEAEALLKDGVAALEEGGLADCERAAMARRHLANLLLAKGEAAGAKAMAQEAVDFLRASGAGPGDLGTVLVTLATVEEKLGEIASALQNYDEGLRSLEQSGGGRTRFALEATARRNAISVGNQPPHGAGSTRH